MLKCKIYVFINNYNILRRSALVNNMAKYKTHAYSAMNEKKNRK